VLRCAPKGFEWTTLDITQEAQLDELYDLLNKNYVEDDDNLFRSVLLSWWQLAGAL
jgi:hypothetical protein